MRKIKFPYQMRFISYILVSLLILSLSINIHLSSLKAFLLVCIAIFFPILMWCFDFLVEWN
jgi:hypothetical protein